ncbi:glycerophosphoryl diester phosphodiesterase [Desulfuromusa kysingii]|uniref:Glycerophosphoryl diester phosphodiesterase n=1 Tax=Desulfuromusa kysingii TaxID=37625 RepID=A0A1H4DWK3_9BACT|nr:glycerophosphodiester phosphodiesterase family protein [Desulfuromusa kysingii]SEA76879.1 glycerophosphoryl diester phosphodiesterase [Desulfuromusa kysingii]
MQPFFARFSGTGYICAHRGARSIAPENTSMAFVKARLNGAHLYETDVHTTADGELVLFHDHTLGRTTDISTHPVLSERSSRPLAEFTYSELKTLDAGSWFISADPFGTIASGEVGKDDFSSIRGQRIPLLRDALADCYHHNFPLNLEIKDQTGTAADQTIVAQVMETIAATQTESLILISSFNHAYLRQIKQLNPAIATAALVEKSHPESLLSYLRDLGVDAYHPDQLITDAELIQQLTSNGIKVNLWTVNDAEKAQYFMAAGATFICTDWPQRLAAQRPS